MRSRTFIGRRTGFSVLTLVAGAAVLSGCSSVIPPEEKEAIKLGASATVGDAQVENLLVVTEGEGQPARLIGVLLNGSEADIEVAIADEDDETTIALEAGQQYAFHQHPTIFETADDIRGGLVDVEVTAAGETETMKIPVLDESLKWLKPYLPQ